MKSIHFKLIVIIFLASFLSNCTEDFLEVYPKDQPVIESFYKTEEHAELAVNGCYDVLGWEGLYNANWWVINMQATEACFGMRIGDHPEKSAFDWFRFDPSSRYGHITDAWRYFFVGIYRCNVALKQIPTIDFNDETLKNRYLGEVHFLRALEYFELVRLFGKLPLYEEPVTDVNYKPSRESVEKIYSLIINDLKFAEENLPVKYESVDVGRATKGAARAILARVYLTLAGTPAYQSGEEAFITNPTAYYDSTVIYCKKVIDDPQYFLWPFVNRGDKNKNGGYVDNFRAVNENKGESIFEVQYTGHYSERYDNRGEGSRLTTFIGLRDAYIGRSGYGGYGWYAPTAKFVAEYEPGDTIRRYITVWRNGDVSPYEGDKGWTWPDEQRVGPMTQGFYPEGYGVKKFYWYDFDQYLQGEDNHIIIRLADVYLMYAEAINERDKGPNDEAYKYLNEVRKRVLLTEKSALDYDQFREAVFHERLYELAFEGVSWYDLVRTKGKDGRARAFEAFNGFVDVYGHNLGEALQERHLLWPVPQVAIDANPNLLPNNPGW